MSLRVLFVINIFLLSGCGSLVGGDEEIVDPPAELTDIQTSLDVSELWGRDTGGGTGDQYLLIRPFIDGERIFITDTNRKVTALNAANGRNTWSLNLDFGAGLFKKGDKVTITSGPGYGDNTVYVGTSDGHVIALDAESGEQQWMSKLSSEIQSPPQKSGDIVIVKTLDAKIFGLSASTGRRLWSYEETAPSLSLHGASSPIISQGIVLTGFDGGSLSALELNSGRLMWEAGIAVPRGRTELERLVDIDANPIVAGGIVYAITFQGELAAIALDSGRILWNREISSHTGFSVDGDFLFVTDDKSIIWSFDRFNGGSIWKQDSLLNRQVSGPAILGNYLIVGDFEGYVHWLDKNTGAFVARQRIAKDRIITAPVTSGEIVYVFASNGELAALTYQ
jgi:outer membrane protein assembly factor BamB